MTALAQAWRALARRPAFAVVAVCTLAAGTAITATVFSVVNAVLWRPLPYPDPAQVVAVYEANPGQRQRVSLIAPPRLDDWRRMSRTFAAISGSYSENMTDTSGVEPERLAGRRVAPGFFDVFAMTPLAGRTFVPEEERYGGAAAAVIAEDFWTRRFARHPSAVGSRLRLGGTAYTIVGVMPRSFAAATDVWLPAQLSPGMMRVREARFLTGVGRLRPGVTPADAREDLAAVQRALGERYPSSDAGWSADVRDLREVRVGEYRRPMLLVGAAVALLFVIAAANVAGLVLVQLHRRAGEFAIRAALGASRRRIASAILREVAIIGALASLLGGALAYWLTRAAALLSSGLPRSSEIRLDVQSVLFIGATLLAAAMICGLLPALAASRSGLAPPGAAGTRTVAGGRHRLQNLVVVAQLALGVVLAGCAGLLVRSYGALASVDSGFDARGVLTFHVGAAWDEDRARIGQLQTRLLGELERLPGVRAAGYANFLPATGATLRFQVRVDGFASDDRGGGFTVGQRTVTPGYLRALAIPLVAGTWCEDVRADLDVTRVRDAMVNRAFVDRVARGGEVLGRQFSFVQQGNGVFRIAGVLGDVLEDGPAAPAAPYVYICLPAGAWPDPEYVVRTDGDTRALAAAVRSIVRAADPSRPLFAMQPLTDVLDAALDQPRLNAGALSGFAAAALILAAIGLSGVLSLVVGERRRELGVRMALGASTADVVRIVAMSAGRLVGAGLAAGALLTWAAAPLLRTTLFGVGPADLSALALATLALALAAGVAIVFPIRRALRVSAIDAMRLE